MTVLYCTTLSFTIDEYEDLYGARNRVQGSCCLTYTTDGLELAVLPLYRIVHVTQIMTGVRLYELYLAEDVLLVVAGGFAPECKLTMLYTASRHGALLRDA
ncbi:hypothetical protein AcV5_005251 [Taiwanofungus camphoratus]|nr:hypothetical protein AcV5_005251 [Antrodia cinnamomea]